MMTWPVQERDPLLEQDLHSMHTIERFGMEVEQVHVRLSPGYEEL